MAESPPTAWGRIFISYRREETAYPAGWLFDRLSDRFGSDQVFKDVDSIELGDDFVEVITTAVGSCDVLLALIGDQWLTLPDQRGRRRIDDPTDFVRVEIEAALSRKVRVIPILVDGATMPLAEELPPSLAALSRRQALELSPSRFDFDTSRLLKVLDRTLAEVRTAQDDAAPPSTPAPAVAEAASTAGPRRRLFTRQGMLVAGGIAAVLVLLLVGAFIATSNNGDGDAVVFEDDFSGQASGWTGGEYADGAYRLKFETLPDTTGFSVLGLPKNANSVYPSAPENVRIAVDARRLSENNPEGAYGITCRNGRDRAYTFTIWGNHVGIAKYGVPDSDAYEELTAQVIPGAVDETGTNRLEAVCKSDGQQVLLEFRVNGEAVADARDTENRLHTGAAGLVVSTGPEGVIEAEFDNFVVTNG